MNVKQQMIDLRDRFITIQNELDVKLHNQKISPLTFRLEYLSAKATYFETLCHLQNSIIHQLINEKDSIPDIPIDEE